MGALLYFGYHYRSYLGNVLKSQIIPIIVLNLVLGFVLNGVDNAAHIGGIIGGILCANALGIDEDRTTFEKFNSVLVLLIYIGFISYLVFFR